MYTQLDMYAAKATMEERQRRAAQEHLIEEAMRANRTQPGNNLRLLSLFSRVLTASGNSLLRIADRLENRLENRYYYLIDNAYEETI